MPPAAKRQRTAPANAWPIVAFGRTTKLANIIPDISCKQTSEACQVIEICTESKTRKRKDLAQDTAKPLAIHPGGRKVKAVRAASAKHRSAGAVETKSLRQTTLTLDDDAATRSATEQLCRLVVDSASTSLPAELHDLVNLHSAFLTTLALHYTHNGITTPADIRTICANITRAWGKRRTTLVDVRRCLGVMRLGLTRDGRGSEPATASLSLSDYGMGKICIEIDGTPGSISRPIDEDLMNRVFVITLRSAWTKSCAQTSITSIVDFINTLPLEPIETCESLAKMSPLLAKGQQRLQELRTASIKTDKPDVTNNSIPGTKSTLLERLRAKQARAAGLPPPPTVAEIQRNAALQRIEEVAAIINLLSTSSAMGQSRVSFTMPTIMSRLRDSAKRAISKDEGEACIRLLAREITPEWLQIVLRGSMEALVVMRERKPADLDIRARIARALR